MSVEPTQFIESVRANIKSIDAIDAKTIVDISGTDLRKQNRYSNRPCAVVSIRYICGSQTHTHQIWVKRVQSPRKAFEAMVWVYNTLAKNHFQHAVPQPYFYDEKTKLIFMEKISGASLRTLVPKYSLSFNMMRSAKLPNVFFNIGRWLATYHRLVHTGESDNLTTLIDRLQKVLRQNTHFSSYEKDSISRATSRILSEPLSAQSFPLVRSHNDFTLRNLFIREDGTFSVIDWDAMIHPEFPRESMGWWDLTALFLHMQSLLKLYPLISKNKIKELCYALIEGYLEGNPDSTTISRSDYVRNILYVMTLDYYIGLDTDRPLYVIYKKKFGRRYISQLRQALISGRADIVND